VAYEVFDVRDRMRGSDGKWAEKIITDEDDLRLFYVFWKIF